MKITRTRMKPLAALGAALMLATLSACSVNPATGKRQLNLLSRAESIQLGEEAKGPLTEEFGGEAPSAALQAYVTEVGMKLVAHTEEDFPSLPWEFTLLNSGVVNAFALPGGKVFITRGLAERFTSEAQLAAVLGHEVAHVTAEHVNSRITKQVGATIIIAGVGVAVSGSDSGWARDAVPALVGVGTGAFLMKFSRNDELESDRLGMRYMAAAGYDPSAMVEVMEVLAAASGGAEGGALEEMFSTHPLPSTRIDRGRSRLSGSFANMGPAQGYIRGEAEYRRRMLEPLKALGAGGGGEG